MRCLKQRWVPEVKRPAVTPIQYWRKSRDVKALEKDLARLVPEHLDEAAQKYM